MNKETERIINKIKALSEKGIVGVAGTENGIVCPSPIENIVSWIKENEFTAIQQAWDACDMPTWMLFFIWTEDKEYSPRLRLAACACARDALEYVPENESRHVKAIETAERFARGEATEAEIIAAWESVCAICDFGGGGSFNWATWAVARACCGNGWDAAGAADFAVCAFAFRPFDEHGRRPNNTDIEEKRKGIADLIRKVIPKP